ncbi:MAG: YggS family pyridoxal phosphate-dependent enzyme [Armatimonadetes bacterium]|nr:YggS family pyridoxal phosphate-dependent enzyme [Akkermansiaceae bacterium]
MSDIAGQLGHIQSRISEAIDQAGRDPESVKLIAVSKTFPAESIREAMEAGQGCFGESRLQEAATKIELLPSSLEWHFIGKVQSNKVRKILPLFPYVHAIDSFKLAIYANDIASELGLFPKVFLQVNQSDEVSKGGFSVADLTAGFEQALSLSNIEVVGLMLIPPVTKSAEDARRWFRDLRVLRDELEQEFSVVLPFLSMGMSGDFEVAIEEGATHVRVGSAIFGKRSGRVDGELGELHE